MAGATAGLIVAAPLASLIVVLPTSAALIAAARGEGIRVDVVVLIAVGIALSVLGAAAIPGALWAERAIRRPLDLRSGSVLAMSWLAMMLGAAFLVLIIGVANVAGNGSSATDEALFGGMFIWGVGVLAFGLPAMVVVVPHSVAWRALMRRVPRG